MKDLALTAMAGDEPNAKSIRPATLERLFAGLFGGLRVGKLNVVLPSGFRLRFEGERPGPSATLEIKSLRPLFRVLASGDLGFAEGYMAGEWDTPDLTSLMALGMLNADVLAARFESGAAAKLLNRFRHARRANTKRGARRNIAAHYDLGNAFFGTWLDDTMTYSAALFQDMAEPHVEAQRRKYLRLARALDLRPGDRVLEIGCGWGEFAEIAAREFGCEVVGLTVSEEQTAFAGAKMRQAGLADRVEIRLQDYRDVSGTFDKIVSIEMFEAVGEENWRGYFVRLARLLNPGGKAGLQVITIADETFENYKKNPDFIQRYIFPGGMLPSPKIFESVALDAGLKIIDKLYFGKSYAESLRRWDKSFTENWSRIAPLGFDERFYRMWRYYFSYCETGFEFERVNVGQFVIEHA
jgi:cyclopropane-fatty-acyl-phospholipid synthase